MGNVKDNYSGHGGGAGAIRMFRDQGDGTYTKDVSAVLYLWDTTNLEWVRAAGNENGELVSSHGKTLLYETFAQGSAGTTTIVSASASNKIHVVSYAFTLDAAGTAKFSDGTDDLSGAFNIAESGGIALAGTADSPLLETGAVNRPFQIVTVTGKASGHISYFLEA